MVRAEGRGSAPAFFIAHVAGAGGGGEWPRSYEAQVREAYLANPVAQRAVRLVAESVAWAPVYAHAGEKERHSTSSGRTVSLVPSSLLETVTGHLLLHGNAFVQILLDAEGEPAELYPLRPERVSVEADRAGWPVAYVYKAGEAKSRIAARDGLGRPGVVHLKAMHPLDDHYGLGCLGAAAGAVAIHNAATKWNKALLDNAARPSGAMVFEPGDGAALSGEQYERLKAEMEAGYQGAANAGRPMLLEGGLKWQAMSLSPADMDFVGLKAAAATSGHASGETFILLDPASFAVIEPALALLGGEVRVSAMGLGDAAPATVSRIVTGEAVRPPAPVHLTAEWTPDGDLALGWIRRSRIGWTWLSGADTPLGEESETYSLTLSGAGVERTVTVTEPAYLYSATEQAADGMTGDIALSVCQIGTFAPSRATELVIPVQS